MKNLSKQKKIFLIVLTILVLLCAIVFAVFCYFVGGLKRVNIDKSPEALGISDSVNQKYPDRDVVNIAVFGVDSRNPSAERGRSDSLMILSIDRNKNCLKLTSILRDSYVAIDGHGHEKICHAYSYGGPELAIKTLNQNFKLNIRDYVTANFAQFSNIVDSMGGIDLNISQKEMNEINKMTGSSSTPLSSYGLVHLNGIQALHYSRIRYIDSDNVRANRQRNVLEALFLKAKKSSADGVTFVKNIVPMLETSLSYTDIIGFAKQFLENQTNLKQAVVPDTAENATGGIYEGAWVWRYNLDAASNRLKKFIYED